MTSLVALPTLGQALSLPVGMPVVGVRVQPGRTGVITVDSSGSHVQVSPWDMVTLAVRWDDDGTRGHMRADQLDIAPEYAERLAVVESALRGSLRAIQSGPRPRYEWARCPREGCPYPPQLVPTRLVDDYRSLHVLRWHPGESS